VYAEDDSATLRADTIGQARLLTSGRFALVAESAVKRRAEARGPAGGMLDPGAVLEGGTVPHVPTVTAVEQGHPVAHVVLDETEYASLHAYLRLTDVADRARLHRSS
jgi:hypothetical protein